ncbi:hypothetical protein [Haloarchaeobius sp. DFWS5]|uniref:hypothetical protein n=1 Tax=Haloarchaeobius sp. DFWS5 TaxID=3446114 RepID=UPI003EBFAC3B
MYRRVALVLVVLVSLPAGVVALESPAATPTPTATPPHDGVLFDTVDRVDGHESVDLNDSTTTNIERTLRLRLTPNEPGEIEAEVVYRVPSEVKTMSVKLQQNADVTELESFTQAGVQTYEWTGESSTATITFTMDANVTSDSGQRTPSLVPATDTAGGNHAVDAPRRSAAKTTDVASEQTPATSADSSAVTTDTPTTYTFVDAGDWAIVRVPQMGTSWEWLGSGTVSLDKRVTVAGEGATGGEMAYLGPMQEYSTTVRDQHVRLVVPQQAELGEEPTDILDAVANASERIRVGERDAEVVMIAAPTTVRWRVAGLQLGDDDAWVVSKARLDSPDNVWLHEYFHTRQEFETTESARWLVEGSADYYAALLAFEQGHISFSEFRQKLARGKQEPHESSVLVAPETWTQSTPYLKGSLVTGVVDRDIRDSTGKNRTFQNVIRRLNSYDDAVTNDDVLAAVERVSTPGVESTAIQYTTTDASPETWSRTVHSRLFGVVPAVMEYEVTDQSVRVAGQFRNESVGKTVTLATGETLSVTASVVNIGERTGTYDAAFVVDDSVVNTTEGTLAPEERETVTFTRTFDRPGNHSVTAAEQTLNVTVKRPAAANVTAVDAPDTVAVGESFTVTTTVTNDRAWPAAGSIEFYLDDELQFAKQVALGPRREATYTAEATFDEPGNHTVRVGGKTVQLSVAESDADRAASSAEQTERWAVPTPGIGVVGTLATLAALLAVAAIAAKIES